MFVIARIHAPVTARPILMFVVRIIDREAVHKFERKIRWDCTGTQAALVRNLSRANVSDVTAISGPQ